MTMIVDSATGLAKLPVDAVPTFETAAMGYDPSIGRTPVEMCNNYACVSLTSAAASNLVKGAPGFLHGITSINVGTSATHIAVYDSLAVGSTLIALIPIGTPVQLDVLMTVGIILMACTVAVNASNVITPTQVVPTANTSAVMVTVSFR